MYAVPEDKSICGHFGDNCGSRCGYCRKASGSLSHGMIVYTLRVDDYQMLIDRGWRRSGSYCYKSIMNETCCPAYTIKCDITKNKLSKSQKKILKKFNKFLCSNDTVQSTNAEDEDEMNDAPQKKSPDSTGDPGNQADSSTPKTPDAGPSNSGSTSNKSNNDNKNKPVNKGLGADPNKAPCVKAKLLRLQRKEEKLKAKGVNMMVTSGTQNNQEKTVEDFINELPDTRVKDLKIKLIKSHLGSEEWKQTAQVSYALYKKYQMEVHNDSAFACTMDQFIRFLVKSPLKIKLVRKDTAEFDSTVDVSFKLFEKYQRVVHDDENEFEEFADFLVYSPLVYEKRGTIEYGSFHQQYWLDDELIAVGVLDILPNCVSSVYFFYNPEYNNLSIGTYGALREIEFTRNLRRTNPAIESYYMGLYIHSCVKMKYKANFHPSYLLCPDTYDWFPVNDCLDQLNNSPYCRLNPDLTAVDANLFCPQDLKQIHVLMDGETHVFETFKRRFCKRVRRNVIHRMEELLSNYGRLVGGILARRVVMYFTGDEF